MSKQKKQLRILNVVPSHELRNNWKASEIKEYRGIAATLPKEVDLRESWWKIANQGQTGSCVGQSSVDGLLRWHLVKAGRIAKDQKMSVRFIWTAAREVDTIRDIPTTFIEAEGTTLKAALDILRKYGCVPEEVLPFDCSAGFLGTANQFYNIASQYKITAYYQLNAKSPIQIREWLANNGPVFCWLPVDNEFMNANAQSPNLKIGRGNLGGHAVCIVGYKDGNFILRNSWGTGWGDRGFGYFDEKFLAAKIKEPYGIKL
jgi:hypothetical protein